MAVTSTITTIQEHEEDGGVVVATTGGTERVAAGGPESQISNTTATTTTASSRRPLPTHPRTLEDESTVASLTEAQVLGSLPPTPVNQRNQAPGILDRRKSSSRSPLSRLSSVGGGGRRGGTKAIVASPLHSPSIRITMAEISPDPKMKDSETFEDASEEATADKDTAVNGDTAAVAVIETESEDDGLTIVTPKTEVEPALAPGAITEEIQQRLSDTAPELDRARSTLSPPPDNSTRRRSISPSKARYRPQPQSPPQPLQGLTGELPLVTSPPPPSTADRQNALEARHVGERNGTMSPPPPPGMARKASSGFAGLLGRMGSIRKTTKSPPASRGNGSSFQRRETASSIASGDSNALAIITDGPEGARPSLQDQFQNLRKQEEYHVAGVNGRMDGRVADTDDIEKTPTKRKFSIADAAGPESPTKENHESRERQVSPPLKSPTYNPDLPPGTALGMSAGPSEEITEVDWDFWQAVVYEGPAGISRTSSDELSQAIASGIPPAIRGVVWQVLAESKSEELEAMYRTLKTRGTDAEKSRPASASISRSASQAENHAENESWLGSPGSSAGSESSTPATSTVISTSASLEDNESSLQMRLLAEKHKREAAAITKLEKAIKRDMGSRTSYSKYTQSAGLQDGLFGVCKAYALFDEGVGYAQGINFITMPLLFNMSEEETFTLLVRLMSKYDLRSLFTAEMTGLHLRLYQFGRLLEDHEPAIYCHLKRRHVTPQLYATQWFLTLFAYRFPLQLVLRVYDLILTEGLTAILKFGLVLMQRNRDTLLGMKDMVQLTTFLKEKIFDVYIDKSPSASSLLDSGFFGSVTGGADKELYRADEMVHDACSVRISDETLAHYTTEWEDSQRTTQDRELELDNLRTTNVSLALRVKILEEQTQQRDTEHVAIAGDIVRLKVENDELHDENEGMKVKIEELQRMVDKQPEEVEKKLKEEMERIMQRNIEVQNENRALREEMDEVETELVNVKMVYAQTLSDHDALKQKWSNVQAMLNDKS